MERFGKIIARLLLIALFFGVVSARYVYADAPTYAPDHLYLTAVSTSQVNLTWTAVSGADGYQIDRETPVGGGFTTIITSNSGLSYNNTGLTAGMTYRYRIAAVNASGTGPFSDSATNSVTTLGAVTVAAVPSAPSNLKATGVAGGVNLSWTAAKSDASITGYKIEREVGGGFTTLIPNTGSAATTYGDSGLSPGATYGYQVSAINPTGPGNPSNIAYGTVPMPPNAPPWATATAGDGQATVSWFQASASAGGVTGYVVITVNGNSSTSVSVGNVLNTTITGLTNGTRYYFLVRGVNAAGDGFATQTNLVTPVAASVVPPPATPPPPPPASTKFVIGDRVQTTANISVHNLSSQTLGTFLGMASHGAQGAVVEGPWQGLVLDNPSGDGYGSWWKINYDTGVDGWSFERYLEKVAPSSVQSLQEQLNALIAQLQALQLKVGGTSSPAPSPPPAGSTSSLQAVGSQLVLSSAAFSRDLDLGSRGTDVKALQEFLIGQNKGPFAEQLGAVGATGYFGTLTQKTLAEYQGSIGISPAVGYFGPKTRSYINPKSF